MTYFCTKLSLKSLSEHKKVVFSRQKHGTNAQSHEIDVRREIPSFPCVPEYRSSFGIGAVGIGVEA
jgi:hypothetical protein